MSFIMDLYNLVCKFGFVTMVYEWEQALYIANGKIVTKPVRWQGKDLEGIVTEERKVLRESGGYWTFLNPFSDPSLPENWKRSKVTGLPRHPKRYERKVLLDPGIRWYVPLCHDVVKASQQDDVLDLGYAAVPTNDEDPKTVILSCNLHYKVMDLERAWRVVRDYKNSVKKHTISILSECALGMSYKDWAVPAKVKEVRDRTLKRLREVVTEDWGLKIFQIYLTHHVQGIVQFIAYDGQAPLIINPNADGSSYTPD